MNHHIRLSSHDSVLLVEMVQDANRNAMTADMKAAFSEALIAAAEPDVRCVVITGSGRAFCAGGDVKAMRESRSAAAVEAEMRRVNESIVLPLVGLAKPTIAAVNGVAAGAGVGIALACDFRVMSDQADLVLAFGRLGLVPDFGVSFTLPRLVGVARAKELALIKGRLTAHEAHHWGLVTELCEPVHVLDRAMEMAVQLAAGPTVALGLTRHILDRSSQVDLAEALEAEAVSQATAATTLDHAAARDALLERRATPIFEGR